MAKSLEKPSQTGNTALPESKKQRGKLRKARNLVPYRRATSNTESKS
jgi:hypothetical protein